MANKANKTNKTNKTNNTNNTNKTNNTRKRHHGKKHKTQKKSMSVTTMEQVKQNRIRNKMIRNIRMGRVHRVGGAQTGGGVFGSISQFLGKPWSSEPGNTGKYFALSPKGVGTGIVPKFDDGRPLGNARFPTQLGPQLAKLGQVGGGGGGSRKRSKRIKVKGGGIVSDFNNMVDSAKYSWNSFNDKMAGNNPPTNPAPFNQPISRNMI